MSLNKFSRSCGHFGITIVEQEAGLPQWGCQDPGHAGSQIPF